MPSLPPVTEAMSGTSNTQVVELSASALDSESAIDVGSVAGLDERGGSLVELDGLHARRTTRKGSVRTHRAFVAMFALGVVACALTDPPGRAFVTERVTGLSNGLSAARSPHAPGSQRTGLAARPVKEIVAPAGACTTTGGPRVLSTRAHLGPGLDVNAADGGFGVGFAASAVEALGIRLDGSRLRVADRVRVRLAAGGAVRHVSVDPFRDEDGLDLRVDAGETRTVVPDGQAPAFRVAVTNGWVQASLVGGDVGQFVPARALWRAPGLPNATANAAAKSRVEATMPTRDGFVRLGTAPARPRVVSVMPPDVRAAAREEGGAVVALRRGSTLWLGTFDDQFNAEGPLLSVPRAGAALGMPSVSPWGGGGAVAWAERPAGDREWIIVVASFAGAVDGAHEAPNVRVIASGMSPSLAMLPDGELLLAYAVGASGSHRVVVQRLGRDLEPRGEPIVVSPDALNAGQPAAAVGADGRGLVAFFAAERGRPVSVLATPVACDPGL